MCTNRHLCNSVRQAFAEVDGLDVLTLFQKGLEAAQSNPEDTPLAPNALAQSVMLWAEAEATRRQAERPATSRAGAQCTHG